MRPTLTEVRKLGNFTTSESWYIQFTKLPAGVSFKSNDLNFRCESVDLPKRSTPTQAITLRGLPPINQHGTPQPSGTTTLTLYSTVDMAVEKAILELQKLAGDSETGKGRYKADYEMRAKIVRQDVTGKAIYEYELYGVLLEDYDPGGQLGATAELIKPTMTLKWDNYTEKALV